MNPPKAGRAEATTAEALPDEVVDAAIAWAVKLDYGTPTPAQRAELEHWLAADQRHALAWQRLRSMRKDFSGLPQKLALDTLNAVDNRARSRRRSSLKLLSLGGAGLFAAWMARQHTPWQRLVADASTGLGERRRLELADGTVLDLNTDTAVSTTLTDDSRLIQLHRGEIRIATGADTGALTRRGAKRPFLVRTPHGTLEALGTRFVVRLEAERGWVSVQEGAVSVQPEAAPAALLRPGESRWFLHGASLPAVADGMEAGAWADGVIAGHDIRLADLLAELGRYRRGFLVCDPRVADLRLSGIYQLNDTDATLAFLTRTQPLQLKYRSRFWVRVEPLDQP